MEKNKIYNWTFKVLAIIGALSVLSGGKCAWQAIEEIMENTINFIEHIAKKESDSFSEWHPANGQTPSEAMQAWLDKNSARIKESHQLILVVTDPYEDFEINFAKCKKDNLSFIQMLGANLQIFGRIDRERKYFTGKAIWNGQEIYIVNSETKEYALLKKEMTSFMIGDYYISSSFHEENAEIDLLIFCCL